MSPARRGRWREFAGKRYGSFPTEDEAAHRWDEVAREHGEPEALMNFPAAPEAESVDSC